MIIHNITVNIDDSIHDTALRFIKEEFITQMLASGKFYKALMTRVNIKEDMGGQTYSMQFRAESEELFREFKTAHEVEILAGFNRFSDKIVMFTTELQVVSEREI